MQSHEQNAFKRLKQVILIVPHNFNILYDGLESGRWENITTLPLITWHIGFI